MKTRQRSRTQSAAELARELEAMPVGSTRDFGNARVERKNVDPKYRYLVRLDLGGVTYAQTANRAAHYVNQINRRVGPWSDAPRA